MPDLIFWLSANLGLIWSQIPIESLREKCPYSELSWSAFSLIRTENVEILRISPYSVGIWENTDQNNSEHERFFRSEYDKNQQFSQLWTFLSL